MTEEIAFENGRISNCQLQGLVTLTLTLDRCNDKVLKLFGRRVGLCVEWSDVNGVQVCCK